jgi:hypothetical protein
MKRRKEMFAKFHKAVVVVVMLWTTSAAVLGQSSQEPEEKNAARTKRSLQWTSNVLIRELALAVGHPLVHSELELLPYQIEQLKQLQYDFQSEVTKTAREFARTKPAERDAGLLEVYERTREEIERVLLPKQSARLEQIAVQSMATVSNSEDGMGLVDLLTQPTIRAELAITDEELQAMQEASQEQSEKLKREIAELRAKANQVVLAKVPAKLREQVQDLIGQPFDFGDFQLQAGGVFRSSKDK